MGSYKKIILIDIRNDNECMEKYLVSNNSDISIYNIPMNHITFNKKWIIDLAKESNVYIVCRSGSRSERVKSTYFSYEKNIIPLEGGISNIKIFDDVVIIKDKGGFGKLQYMILCFLIILLVITFLIYKDYSRIDMLLILIFVIFFITYQLLGNISYIDNLIPLYKTSV